MTLACTYVGDSDLYGRGPRLSLYLIGFSSILARIIAPSHVFGIHTSLRIILTSIIAGLIRNTMQKPPSTPPILELYLVSLITHTVQLLQAVSGGTKSGGIFDHAWEAITMLAQFSVTVMIAFTRRSTGVVEGCNGAKVRFFVVVDARGVFSVLLGVYAVLAMCFVISRLTWTVAKRVVSGNRKGWNPVIIAGCGTPAPWATHIGEVWNVEEDKVKYEPIPKVHVKLSWKDMVRLGIMVALLALGVWFTEDTLSLNRIVIDDDLDKTGQMLPIVVGVGSMLSVLSGWVDDRMLNAMRTRTEKAKQGNGQT